MEISTTFGMAAHPATTCAPTVKRTARAPRHRDFILRLTFAAWLFEVYRPKNNVVLSFLPAAEFVPT
jgi:hypothetical protein